VYTMGYYNVPHGPSTRPSTSYRNPPRRGRYLIDPSSESLLSVKWKFLKHDNPLASSHPLNHSAATSMWSPTHDPALNRHAMYPTSLSDDHSQHIGNNQCSHEEAWESLDGEFSVRRQQVANDFTCDTHCDGDLQRISNLQQSGTLTGDDSTSQEDRPDLAHERHRPFFREGVAAAIQVSKARENRLASLAALAQLPKSKMELEVQKAQEEAGQFELEDGSRPVENNDQDRAAMTVRTHGIFSAVF